MANGTVVDITGVKDPKKWVLEHILTINERDDAAVTKQYNEILAKFPNPEEALGHLYNTWDDQTSWITGSGPKGKVTREVMQAVKLYIDVKKSHDLGTANVEIPSFEDLWETAKEEGRKQWFANNERGYKTGQTEQKKQLAAKIGLPDEYRDAAIALYPDTVIADYATPFDARVYSILKNMTVDLKLDPTDKASYEKLLLAINGHKTKDGAKHAEHVIEHGMKVVDPYCENDYYDAAAKIVAKVYADRKVNKQVETQKAESAEAMKTTSFTGEGRPTELAMRELFGDRDAKGYVILELDENKEPVPYINPSPYSRATGRKIADNNGYGIAQLHDKIANEVLTNDNQKAFMEADRVGRDGMYADLYKKWQEAIVLAKKNGTGEKDPGQQYEEAIAILWRGEQIEKVRLAGDNSLPTLPVGDYYDKLMPKALDYARVAAGEKAQLKTTTAPGETTTDETVKDETTKNDAPTKTKPAFNIKDDALVQAAIAGKVIEMRTSFIDNPDADITYSAQKTLYALNQEDPSKGYDLGTFGDGTGRDGKLGGKTSAAIKKFQETHGLAEAGKGSGKLDKDTMALLQVEDVRLAANDKTKLDAELKDIAALQGVLTDKAKEELKSVLGTLKDKVTDKDGALFTAFNTVKKAVGLA